jgi:hypothetical protein
MAETAVGLFEQSQAAERVVEALTAQGIASSAIRVLSKPTGMAVTSVTSTPSVDFGAALAKDLRCMGATEEECEAYVTNVQSGCFLMFVTGTAPEAHSAASVMNAHGAIQIEEFAGAVPVLPGIHVGEIEASGISLKEDRARARTEGARVFTW